MATYTETLELKDMVSGPAKAMADSVSLIGKGIASVNRSLVKLGSDVTTTGIDKFVVSMSKLVPLLERLVALGPIRMPRAPGEAKIGSGTTPKALPSGKTPLGDQDGPDMSGKLRAANEKALVKAAKAEENRLVKEAAAEAKAIFKQKADEEKALVKENALAKKQALADEKALAKQAAAEGTALAKQTAAAEKSILQQRSADEKKLIKDNLAAKKVALAEEKALAKTAAAQENALAKDAAAAAQLTKQSKLGAMMVKKAGPENLTEKMLASQGAIGTEKAPKAPKGLSIEKILWNARNAMDVGRQTIEAGIGGIRNAFVSLGQGDVRGAVQGVTDSIAGMAKMLDMVVPGLGQVVSAVVSIAGGLVGITAGLVVAGAKFAVFASQGKQQMLSMFDAMGGGVVSGGELDDMLSGLADRIGITKDELAPLTQGFLQMGVTGVDALEKLTLAAISANAIVGEGGAAAFSGLQKKIALAVETGQKFKLGTKQLLALRDAGVGVSDIAGKMGMKTEELATALAAGTVDAKLFGDALTEAVIAKGAGPLQRLASSFDAIKKKWDQDIGDLFEDIDVGPFMAGVKSLFEIFGQANPSGQALKAGIGGFFKEVFATATKVVPLVKHFLLDLVIWGLDAYLAIIPIEQAIRGFLASSTGIFLVNKGWDVLSGVLKIVGVVLLSIAVIVGVVIAVWAGLVAIAAVVGFALWDTVVQIAGFVVAAMETLNGWADSAWQIATDFVTGLVDGIVAGAGLVTGAVSKLATGAIGAIKGIFQTQSPSKVMFGIGGNVGEGLQLGMEDTAPDVHGAASGIASMAVQGASDAATAPASATAGGGASGGAGAAGGGGSKTVTVNIESVNIEGAGKDLQGVTQEMFAVVLEQMALQAGL